MTAILGLDPGERRIGMALADDTVRLARPLGVLVRRSRQEDFAELAALVGEHGVRRIVVGQPLDEDGRVGGRARTAARWAAALAAALGAPPPASGTIPAMAAHRAAAGEAGLYVVLWDERMSTVTALQIQQAQGKRGKRAKRARAQTDAVAAAVILQDYLDSQIFPTSE